MADNEPMTDERLAEIRGRWQWRRKAKVMTVYGQSELFHEWVDHVADDETALLAEVERLRAEVDYWRAETARCNEHRAVVIAERDAMRLIVAAVAEHIGGYVSEHFRQCAFCGNGAIESRIIAHANDCEVEQARAFLAAGQAAESEGE